MSSLLNQCRSLKFFYCLLVQSTSMGHTRRLISSWKFKIPTMFREALPCMFHSLMLPMFWAECCRACCVIYSHALLHPDFVFVYVRCRTSMLNGRGLQTIVVLQLVCNLLDERGLTEYVIPPDGSSWNSKFLELD